MAASGKKRSSRKTAPKKRVMPPGKKPGLLPTGNTEGYTEYTARPPENIPSEPEQTEDSFAQSENSVYEESDRERFMTLGDHLEELRIRLIWIIGVLLVSASTAGVFIDRIHSFLVSPYKTVIAHLPPAQASPGLILGSMYGSIEIYFKLAVMIGSLVSLPISLSLIWGFVTPAVSKKIARIGHLVVASSTLLFWSGVVFAWQILFPVSLEMMLGTFLPQDVIAQTTLEKYYSFLFMIVLGSGVTFQLPMVIVILGAIGIVPVAFHKRAWKFVVLGMFVFSAFFTPPDPLSIFLMVLPLWAMYIISVFFVWLIEKGRRRRDKERAKEMAQSDAA
ncbi:MAG: twin-arginine translocase subunit TatC [Leptonema illini]|jgi:sec-independent protein translocase protein TatC|uniref:Sec-independent protein translocase protein TatC n=1 Tax=Leptonema illini TaxID=183 RepID=A0A833LYF3_9LEPT|nr:MAG: twin-arginine translocase subunit TatC [Leptonema illini]